MGTITVSGQLTTFALSLLLGAAFSLLYDLFRHLHIKYFGSFWQVFFSDILYWLLILFFTYSFLLLYCNGTVRGYVLIGCFAGFVICRFTFSKIFIKILSLFSFLFEKLFTFLLIPIQKLYDLVLFLSAVVLRFTKKAAEKIFKKRKKHLERDNTDGV